MAINDPDRRTTTGPAKKNWIPYIIAGVILLAFLLFALRGCDDTEDNAAMNAGANDPALTGQAGDAGTMGNAGAMGGTGAAAGGMGAAAAGAFSANELRTYLQTPGTDAAGRSFGLDQVMFDSGSSTLDAGDQGVISEAAGVLKQFPNAGVTITSYADPEGDPAANRKLAAARAVAVKNAMASAGVPAAQLKTNVVGETGNAAIPQNRRVELLVQRP